MKEVIPKLPPVRSEVREYAEYRQSVTEDGLARGDNIYQLDLDMQDKLERIANKWSDEDKIAYFNMLAEEMDAIAKRLNDKAQEIRQSHANNTASDSDSFQWIVAIVFSVFMLIFLFK